MSILDPSNLTVGDICTEALREANVTALGQDALPQDITLAWSRLQMLLQEWQRKRWTVYHLLDFGKISTGATSYTVGPGGAFDTGSGSSRPTKIESAYVRQLINGGLPVDFPLRVIASREEWSRIALKTLKSFPGQIFLDTGFPFGTLYPNPVPPAEQYELHCLFRAQLPTSFANTSVVLNLPYEYYSAILYNLALRVRAARGLGTYGGDPLPALARSALDTVKGTNVQVDELQIDVATSKGRGAYNFFSDQFG